MFTRKLFAGHAAIALAGLALCAGVFIEVDAVERQARDQYRRNAHVEAQMVVDRTNATFDTIYKNLRTIAALPSIRRIAGQGTSLDADDRETIQQIYNNLSGGAQVSELYVVGADFDPQRIDPATGRPAAPLLTFDEFIIGAGRYAKDADPFGAARTYVPDAANLEEVESHEYEHIARQIAWFRQNYPNRSKVDGFDVPMIASPELITCDNTLFAVSGLDADRKGFVFAVPVYDTPGNLMGVVTATMLTINLNRQLPEGFSLVNADHGFTSNADEDGEVVELPWAADGVPHPDLLYSEVLPVASHDRFSPWSMWVGFADRRFLTSAEALAVDRFALTGFAVAAILIAAMMLFWTQLQYNLSLVVRHRDRLENEIEAATHDLKDKASRLETALGREKELNALQREFVSMASHEFRTPLAIIDATVQGLKRRFARLTPDEIGEKLDQVRGAVLRMTQLMESTLTAARMEGGHVQVAIADCDIGALVSQACERQREISPNGRIDCVLKDPPQAIRADPGAIEQILANLLSNAVKYSGASFEIEVLLRSCGGTAIIEVSDRGLGIDEDELPRIFERFFRARTSTGIAGTGIGLNLCRMLVELHGGTISVTSRMAAGSTFTITLPIAGPAPANPALARAA